MNVKELNLVCVTRYAGQVLEFPRTGLVLVTGKNRAGKSTIVEAVATACWNETTRGTPVWSGDVGVVGLRTYEGLAVVREKTPKRVGLAWSREGEPAVQYETPSKAQEALDRVVGPFEVWRRARAFATRDATLFSEASDGVRKRFLEELMGLDRFGEGLAACRNELRNLGTAYRAAEAEVARVRGRIAAEEARLADAQQALAGLPLPANGGPGNAVEHERLAQVILGLNKEASALAKRAEQVRRSGWETRARMQDLEQKLGKLAGAECPTCGQQVPEALREGIRTDLDAARKVAAEKSKTNAVESSEIEELVAENRQESERLTKRQNELAGAHVAAGERARFRADLEAKLKEIEPALADLRGKLAAGEADLARAQQAVDELDACEQVLGLQGVRAQLLDGALRGLEKTANLQLARIAWPGFELQLSSTTDLKSGAVADRISFDVRGAGGVHGYKAASEGEKRRINVALVFALGALAEGAYAQEGGTTFFDEVFDALDEEGVALVAHELAELARTRCVVVISHNSLVAQHLRADRHWHVQDGVVVGA